jgi:hypothetical protein
VAQNAPVWFVDGFNLALRHISRYATYKSLCAQAHNDFNPIEQVFAKLKAVLRKIAAYMLKGAAYSLKRLCKTIAACLDEISRAECAAYFAHSGYRST